MGQPREEGGVPTLDPGRNYEYTAKIEVRGWIGGKF